MTPNFKLSPYEYSVQMTFTPDEKDSEEEVRVSKLIIESYAKSNNHL
jgi:hypothetical protein